ncbi:MAG: NADH-quinone oxidoreductase subunit H [Deltaproteobacteria bacterium]|nr:NADH-quinone oxidoreductase subunit H [Deltaproteobacteria bacterium]
MLQDPVRLAVHLALLVALPPLLPGVIEKTKAVLAGRRGPPVLQGYYDLAKLLRKGLVLSRTTTWLFPAGPVTALATAWLAGLVVPLAWPTAPLGFVGDPILFAYLLALGRFFTTAAALDTGSSFEGMGAAREATFACLTEAAVFFGFLTLAKLGGTLRLAEMLNVGVAAAWGAGSASLVLIGASLFVVLLAENSRIPFDDPNTHLELTMVHEVMVLDHSGPLLGLVSYGSAVKLFLFSAVLLRATLPVATGVPAVELGAFVGGILAVAVGVGVVESSMARLRLIHVPALLVGACVLSAFAFLLVLH